MPTLFEPDQVARSLGLSASGLRKLSVELAGYLSPSAQGRAGGSGRAQRRYSEQDLELLRTARAWLKSGVTYPEVRRRLSEIRPPAGGTVEPPRAETAPEPPPPAGTSTELLALDSMRLALAALRTTVDAQDQVIDLQRSEIARLQRQIDELRAAQAPPAPPPPSSSPEPPAGGTVETEPPPVEVTSAPRQPWWDRLRRALGGE